MAQHTTRKVADLAAALGRGQTAADTAHAPATGQGFTTRTRHAPTVATQIRLDAELYEWFRLRNAQRKVSQALVVEQLIRDLRDREQTDA